MEYKDYYEIMGVKREATQDEIKRAYRKLARKYHPDVSKASDAEDRFKEVGEAYEVLKDPEKRTAYDQLGSNWQQGQDFQPPPGWQDALSSAAAVTHKPIQHILVVSLKIYSAELAVRGSSRGSSMAFK